MPTPTIATPGTQLIAVLSGIEISEDSQKLIISKFAKFDAMAAEWAEKASSLVVTDESQVQEMKDAREARLGLRKVRTDADRLRKELKEESLRYGQAVQAVANHIKAKIEPIEAHLQAQEDFAKNKAAERINAIRIERSAMVADLLEFMPEGEDLGAMPQVIFDAVLAQATEQRAAQIKAEQEAEAERIAKEEAERAEQARIRAENERLRAEAAAKEAELKAERDRVAAERAEAERKAQAERDAIEAERKRVADKLAEANRKEAERKAEAERAEAKRIAKERAEAAAKKEAERKAKAAPDKAKLNLFVLSIEDLKRPEVTSERATRLVELFDDKLADLVSDFNSMIEAL